MSWTTMFKTLSPTRCRPTAALSPARATLLRLMTRSVERLRSRAVELTATWRPKGLGSRTAMLVKTRSRTTLPPE